VLRHHSLDLCRTQLLFQWSDQPSQVLWLLSRTAMLCSAGCNLAVNNNLLLYSSLFVSSCSIVGEWCFVS
jgi:hypothetical protein